MITTDDTKIEQQPRSVPRMMPRLSGTLTGFAIAAAVLATGALAVGIRGGITSRVAAKSNLVQATEEASVPFVKVVQAFVEDDADAGFPVAEWDDPDPEAAADIMIGCQSARADCGRGRLATP